MCPLNLGHSLATLSAFVARVCQASTRCGSLCGIWERRSHAFVFLLILLVPHQKSPPPDRRRVSGLLGALQAPCGCFHCATMPHCQGSYALASGCAFDALFCQRPPCQHITEACRLLVLAASHHCFQEMPHPTLSSSLALHVCCCLPSVQVFDGFAHPHVFANHPWAHRLWNYSLAGPGAPNAPSCALSHRRSSSVVIVVVGRCQSSLVVVGRRCRPRCSPRRPCRGPRRCPRSSSSSSS